MHDRRGYFEHLTTHALHAIHSALFYDTSFDTYKAIGAPPTASPTAAPTTHPTQVSRR